jgi:hypothetical protein
MVISGYGYTRHSKSLELWADSLHADIRGSLLGNCYINLTTDLGPEWRSGAWGSAAKYQRLIEAKTKWDPSNMLRHNKNIEPESATSAT